MTVLDCKRTNINGDTEVSGRSPDAEGDFYHITDRQQDVNYLDCAISDLPAILSEDPTEEFMILYGGVVSDGGSGTINISEGVAKGKDSDGNRKLIHIPTLTGVALPSGWNDDRQIWVVLKHDFKLSSATRTHRAGVSYHYQTEDTYLGDTNGENSTGTSDLFVDSDPTGTAVILGSFKMNSTAYANQNVRTIEYKAQTRENKIYSNITVKRNASNPNYQVDIEWDSLYIEGILSTLGDFTLNITASGLLGLDTGSEAVSTWYYVWAIAKTDGTVSTILSASSTSPTMPSGYTLKRLISMVRNDSSGNFVDFVQQNNQWFYTAKQTLYSSSSTTTTSANINCSQWIPSKVKKLTGHFGLLGYKSGTTINLQLTISGYINSTKAAGITCAIGNLSGDWMSFSTPYSLATCNKTIYRDESAITASMTSLMRAVELCGFEVEL